MGERKTNKELRRMKIMRRIGRMRNRRRRQSIVKTMTEWRGFEEMTDGILRIIIIIISGRRRRQILMK